jgi:hypothetical protein
MAAAPVISKRQNARNKEKSVSPGKRFFFLPLTALFPAYIIIFNPFRFRELLNSLNHSGVHLDLE